MASGIAAVEKLLADIRTCLKIKPRNAYQAEGVYMTNMERLREAREKIGAFSGEYVDRLLREVDELERAVNDMVLAQTNSVDILLNADFGAGVQQEEEDGDDEIAVAAQELEKKRGGRKKRPNPKTKSKNTEHREKHIPEKGPRGEVDVVPSPKPERPPMQSDGDSATKMTTDALAVYSDCKSQDIPQEAIGTGKCEPVLNTPLARLVFDAVVEYDGHPCNVCVTLHRAVITALSFGTPSSEPIGSQNSNEVDTAGADDGVDAPPEAGDALEKMLVDESFLAGVQYDVEDECDVDEDVENDDAATTELSKQLVAEYDAIQEERKHEEEEGCSSGLPFEISTKLSGSLRSFTLLPWVVLMCHGGFFAGGVFIDGKSVVHKAFQRYVVRKKQGGKQSSNEKEGGSYGSIGSQIRRAQEIRWRIEVRDILMRWRRYINAAALVLYVAPGPKNRNVLMDFSQLPPTTFEHGERAASPVSLKDPRVHKAPLTTHRPSFQEVQRIYDTVSMCSVSYILRTDL